MADWLEYMTSDTDSTLANCAARTAATSPGRLHYFGVGNETWGCGGNMRPEYYADLYRHYVTFLKAPEGSMPLRIASGANGSGLPLDRSADARSRASTWTHQRALLHAADRQVGQEGRGHEFTEDEWCATLRAHLAHGVRSSPNTRRSWTSTTRTRRVGLYVDEWGTWYDVEPGTNPGFLYQQNTLRDAVVAAVNLNIFHAHADRVRMTNIAQMVNVLQAMILTDKGRMLLTPTYHVFHMYKPFRGATHLPVELVAPQHKMGETSAPTLTVSAARGSDGKLHIALVNLNPREALIGAIRIPGATPKKFSGTILTATAMDAHNTFDKPETVKPAAFKGARVQQGLVHVEVPAKSIIVLSETAK